MMITLKNQCPQIQTGHPKNGWRSDEHLIHSSVQLGAPFCPPGSTLNGQSFPVIPWPILEDRSGAPL